MFSRSEIRSLVGLSFLYATRMLGLFMVLPVFALYAEGYQGSTTILVGLGLGIYGLSQGLLQIPFGLMSDRLGRKPLIIGGMLLFLLGSALCAVADSWYTIIAGRALQGAGAVASVIMALLSDVTREQVRTRAMAMVGGSIGLSFALAMVMGPIVASHWGLSGVFWLTTLLAGLGIIVVVTVVPTPSLPHSGHQVIPVPAMLGQVLRDKELLRLDIGIFFLHFSQMAIWLVIPVLLEQNFDFGRDRHWFLYLTTMGGGFLLMLPLIWYGESKRKMKPVFIIAIALLALSEWIMASAGSLFDQIVIGLLLFFMAFNLLEATLPSLVAKLAPAGIKGTAMGVYSTSQFLGTFVGGISGGVIARYYGGEAVFLVAVAGALIWLAIAITMKPPRKFHSLEVNLIPGRHFDGPRLIREIRGVEDVVVISKENLAYIKIDEDDFDEQKYKDLMSRLSGR